MYVVIVGARERDQSSDQEQVHALVEALVERYPGLVIVSSACDRGIGGFVRMYCTKQRDRVRFVDIGVHLSGEFNKGQLANVYLSRNATLFEVGDEYHVFVNAPRRGWGEDLIKRVHAENRGVYVHDAGRLTFDGFPVLQFPGAAPTPTATPDPRDAS